MCVCVCVCVICILDNSRGCYQHRIVSHGRGGMGAGGPPMENHKWLKVSLKILIRTPRESIGPIASRERFVLSSVKRQCQDPHPLPPTPRRNVLDPPMVSAGVAKKQKLHFPELTVRIYWIQLAAADGGLYIATVVLSF